MPQSLPPLLSPVRLSGWAPRVPHARGAVVNWDETCDLLTLAAAYDSRTVGESDVQAWLLALADLPFDRCRDAVVRHYSTETDRIMPGHVRRLARTTTGGSTPPGEVMCPSCHAVHGPRESCAVLVADPGRWRKALASGRALTAELSTDPTDPARTPSRMRFNEPPPEGARADMSPPGGTGAPPTDSEPGATAYQEAQ